MSDLDDMFLELKDTSELMVDLAYSALLYNNKEIARLVFVLEDRIDKINLDIQQAAISHAVEDRKIENALTIIRLATSMESIADAALDIVDVVLRDIEPHPILKMSIHDSDVIIQKAEISRSSVLVDRPLGELRLASETGMWVIAILRGDIWHYGVNEASRLQAGDIVVVRGPVESEEHFRDLALGRTSEV